MTLIEEPRPDNLVLSPVKQSGLAEQMKRGLDAPICLTWELTCACNLQCVHCLSSSGRRDPRELTTEECESVIDELQRMQVFDLNIGGGEPTIRIDASTVGGELHADAVVDGVADEMPEVLADRGFAATDVDVEDLHPLQFVDDGLALLGLSLIHI